VVVATALPLAEVIHGIATGTEMSIAIGTFEMLLLASEGTTIVPTGLVAMKDRLHSAETDLMSLGSAQRLQRDNVEIRKRA